LQLLRKTRRKVNRHRRVGLFIIVAGKLNVLEGRLLVLSNLRFVIAQLILNSWQNSSRRIGNDYTAHSTFVPGNQADVP